MGSRAGVMKIAAKRVGLSLGDYLTRIAAGEKWCTRCGAWHPVSAFGRDEHRGDGLSAHCLDSARVRQPMLLFRQRRGWAIAQKPKAA